MKSSYNVYFLLVLFVAITFQGFGQAISKGTGNWNTAGSWTASVAATGTITVALNGTAVTGVGTNFTGQLTVGDPIFNGTSNYIGIIASITNATNLVLVEGAFVAVAAAAYRRTDPTNTTSAVPNATTIDVVIRNGHTITQNASPRDVRVLAIASGGAYQTDNNNRTLTVNNRLTVLSGGDFNSREATLTVTLAATITGTFRDNNNNGSNTFNATLTVNTGGSFDAAQSSLTVAGATSISGTFQDTNTNGTNTMTGLVTINVGGTFSTTTITTTTDMVFRGGIANNGIFNAGAANFNTTAAQSISGANAMSFANDVTITGAITVTNNNTNTVTINGNLDGSAAGSTWTQAAGTTLNYGGGNQPFNTNGALNAGANCNTINYNAANSQGVRGTTYCNLSITGNNTKTLQGATTVTNLLTVTNTLITSAPTLELDIQDITVTGTTVITGAAVTTYGTYGAGNGAYLSDNNATGTNTFTGLASLAINGDWNTNASNVIFQGGITNNGRRFVANTANFNGTQNIAGAGLARFNGNITIAAGSIVTNSGFVYAAGLVQGSSAASSWVNTGFLKYDNGTNLMTTGIFNASADYNTVDYICNCPQVVKDIDYYNLTVTNSTKTMAPSTTRNVNGMLTVKNSNFTVSTIKLNVKLATVGHTPGGAAASFNNTSTAVAGTTTNFNQNTAFTGKFDVISASNDDDSYAYSNNGSDVVLQRGIAGGVYAVKTTNFTTAPTQFVAQFEFEAKTKSTNTNVATILLGDGFTNDLTRNTATARLQFNIDAANNQYSITNPDGTVFTSTPLQNSRQTITWVINRVAGTYNYTDPLGVANTVTANSVDIWIGTSLIVNNSAMQTTGMAVNDIKLIYDTSNEVTPFQEKSNITISNLRFYLTPPTNISGVINRYTSVSALNVARTQLTVASNTGFVAGNRVMVIQMKNATIDNTDAATYGNITSYNNAGKFELARIASVTGGTTVNLTSGLLNTYDAGTANAGVQLIFVPEYANVIVDGLLTAQAWNPSTQTGGVLALAATGTVTLQADVDVTGLGFKGGIIGGNNGNCREGTYRTNDMTYGQKGEGITTDANDRGRGKLANGGGGGNPHNSGGGGGGNFGKGANGARQWNCLSSGTDSSNDCIDDAPGSMPPTITEINSGGGGAILDYTTGRIFLGGGGGSGQQNDGFGTSGANGGGIIVMLASAIDGNGFLMAAKGASVLATAGNDAGGGGGAGGAIFLDTKVYGTTLRINVQGGKGGDVDFSTCHGNGGGGGGGVLRLQINPTPANLTVVRGGGPSSRNADNSDCALTANSYFCAESTGDGGVIFNNISILPVTISTFNARKLNTEALLEWTTSQEINAKHVLVERSNDGIIFSTITAITTKGNSSSFADYSWIDTNPMNGVNYYRLKFVDIDTKTTYSQIKTLSFENTMALLAEIYPNPATKNGFFVVLRDSKKIDNMIVTMYDMLGRTVETTIQKTAMLNTFQIVPKQNNLTAGIYVVDIVTDNIRTTKKLMIE